MSYKDIYTVRTVATNVGTIALNIQLEMSTPRELTQTEEKALRTFSDAFTSLIRKNSLMQDPAYMAVIQKEREDLIACFDGHAIYVKTIANGYDKECLNPWFSVTTAKGVIEIGWRKRVIDINWSKSDIAFTGHELFHDEDTTVDNTYVHAWGYEKAKEYITKLLNT